ncbi:MAG: nicotinamide mononucleotide transporter [Pseudomonadales bacterium]|nr:nicotinamide mononucleotide transporter [Pseudomonadales bacterium]
MSLLLEQLLTTSWPELIAVVLAVIYLLLVVRENILCWYAAFISTAIFLWIFWDVHYYMEAALQVFYLVMAVYGYFQWRQAAPANDEHGLSISTRPWRWHLRCIAAVLLVSVGSGYLLTWYTDARLPFLDSLTTWASVVTTWMVARKILENWLYWLVIDSVSIYLYLDRALYFTALLFTIYIIIIGFGWRTWYRQYTRQQTTPASARP